MNRIDEKINTYLDPMKLHARLEEYLNQTDKKEQVISLFQITSNTLKIGHRLNEAFKEIGKKLNIKSDLKSLKTGEASPAFFSELHPAKDAYMIIHIHAKEDEERLLEYIDKVDFGQNLILYIHRPEELILRLAFENKVDYERAKHIAATYLQKATAIVLPGPCYLDEYRKLIPEKIVVSIPLGTVISIETFTESTVRAAGDIFFIGSSTTWGEMRHIDDVISLLEAIKHQSKPIQVVGFVMGTFDKHTKMEQYSTDNRVTFLGNDKIISAFRSGAFHDESGFRKWLFTIAQGKVIIRAKLIDGKVIPESFSDHTHDIYEWENAIIDFNVQMYHEILDAQRPSFQRGLPKVEYSGTLHKASNPFVFVVLDSLAMWDIQHNEGLKMIMTSNKAGCIDFNDAANKIIDLARNKTVRMEMIRSNIQSMKTVGMREVAFAYFTLITWLKRISNIDNRV